MAAISKKGTWAICCALAVLGAATPLFTWSRIHFPGFFGTPESPLEALYRTSRLVYPRLSLPQAYQPCRVEAEPGLVPGYDCRSGAASQDLLRQKWPAAERSLRSGKPFAREDAQSSPWLLRLATAGKGQAIAVARGIESEARASANAGLWIDTSAAFYIAATAEDLPGLLSSALSAAEKALELEPRNPAAVFNRALILEALALRHEAAAAWRDFFRFEEQNSPWKAEGQQHLEALYEPTRAEQWELERSKIEGGEPVSESRAEELVARFPYAIRDWIEFELLPAWAEAWLRKDSQTAEGRRSLVTALADALKASLNEGLPAAQIHDLHEALSTSNGAVPDSLARAILGLRDARASYLSGGYQVTLDTLARVERDLGTSRPTLLLWVRYYRAASLDQQGRKQRADEFLASLVAEIESKPFPSLRARAQALRGRIKNNLGRPEEAIPLLEAAIETLDRVKDAETAVWARTLLGDSYRLLGDHETCWQHYYRALHQIEHLGTPLRELAALNAMSDFLLNADDEFLAFHYQNAAVSLGPKLGNPDFFADVLLRRALLRMRRGDESGAREDLERARGEAAKIEDPLRLERFQADFALYMGAELLDRDPAAAVDALGKALEYFAATEHWSRILLSLEARALAHGRLKDREAELRDLERAWDLYAKVGRQLKQDAIRISFAGRIENAFDQILRLRVKESLKPEISFLQIEQERALNHPILVNGSWKTKPVGLSAVHSALSPSMALLEYAVLSDRILIWLVLDGKVSLFPVSLAKTELSAALKNLLTEDWDSPQWRQQSASLGHILLGPVQTELARAGVTSLIIVPDDELFGTPFAALTLPETGRLLVQDYALAVSPSASLFARAVRRSNADQARRESLRALVVANPAIDEAVWAHLPRLQAASAEGARVQQLFPGDAELLAEGDATASLIRSRLTHASWFHFAGHAVTLPRRPLDSYLLLGKSPDHSGKLTAAELLTWDLNHLRGVVLSACESASSPQESWPGAMTLARPFLAAGAPMVIGSLWNVEDRASAAFFEVFYRQLALRGSAFEAFHEAQLAELARSSRGGLDKNGWIAFQFFGGPDTPALQ